jgi:hypothetical protein
VQGVSWWRRRRLLELVNASSGGAAAAECSGPEWSLALSAGQNDFSIFVTSSSATAQARRCCAVLLRSHPGSAFVSLVSGDEEPSL